MSGLIAVLVGGVLGASVALGLPFARYLRAICDDIRAVSATLERAFDASEGSVRAQIRDLEDLVDRLPQRWEEIKREASRLDARARYAVGRAREQLAEHDLTHEGLEDIGRELRVIDGGGSEQGELLPLPAEVDAPAPAPHDGDWRDEARALLTAKRGF